MRRTARAACGVVLVVVLGVFSGPLPSQAASADVVADWQMQEAAGSRTMTDSSGNGIVGTIGAEVVTGVPTDAPEGLAYRFERLRPNTPPARPEHNVLVPHDDRLGPAGRALFVVEIRLRTTNSFGNVVQKGQAGASGGYWKIQLPQAEPSCLFRGPTGVTNAVRARGVRVDDGAWHTVRCEATPSEVRLYVDGAYIGRNRGLTGPVANQEQLAVGGKDNCDQVTITCDYFGGDVDYVRLERSAT